MLTLLLSLKDDFVDIKVMKKVYDKINTIQVQTYNRNFTQWKNRNSLLVHFLLNLVSKISHQHLEKDKPKCCNSFVRHPLQSFVATEQEGIFLKMGSLRCEKTIIVSWEEKLLPYYLFKNRKYFSETIGWNTLARRAHWYSTQLFYPPLHAYHCYYLWTCICY